MRRHIILLSLLALPIALSAQAPRPTPREPAGVTVLRPARVFDGEAMHDGWAVRVAGTRIEAVGPAASVVSANAQVVDLAGLTLTPGLIEGHSHVLLHPYNEATWDDQVTGDAACRLYDASGPWHRRRRLR